MRDNGTRLVVFPDLLSLETYAQHEKRKFGGFYVRAFKVHLRPNGDITKYAVVSNMKDAAKFDNMTFASVIVTDGVGVSEGLHVLKRVKA